MWYINKNPVNDNYGNPTSFINGPRLVLPDNLLDDYISTRGFALIQEIDGVVTSVSVNQPALDAYLSEHPDKEPEPPAPSVTADLVSAYLDLEARLSYMELSQQGGDIA